MNRLNRYFRPVALLAVGPTAAFHPAPLPSGVRG